MDSTFKTFQVPSKSNFNFFANKQTKLECPKSIDKQITDQQITFIGSDLSPDCQLDPVALLHFPCQYEYPYINFLIQLTRNLL